MNDEAIKRIFTSIFLLPILFFATVYSGIYLILLLILVYFLCAYEIIKNTRNIFFNIFANIWLIFSFYCFYYLRGDTEYSLIILFWILISTFLSDIGGYIFGKFFKGPKLSKLSPNKTISGALGSLILSCVTIFFTLYYLTKSFDPLILLIGCLISISCQVGDLFFSFLKRKSNLKDTSNFLPGHGGLLDRVDGILFGLPVGFFTLIMIY